MKRVSKSKAAGMMKPAKSMKKPSLRGTGMKRAKKTMLGPAKNMPAPAKKMPGPKMAHNTTFGRKATLPATGTKSRRAGSPPKRKLGSKPLGGKARGTTPMRVPKKLTAAMKKSLKRF